MEVLTRGSQIVERGPCVLVPTMGALHEGHLSLIRLGVGEASRRGLAGGCVVSVFVNPTQFNDPDDFERYPRSLESDAHAAMGAGADAVYAPKVEEVYPNGAQTRAVQLPAVASMPGLEDRHRPGHFAGVYRVCARLFELTGCRVSVFGEKDWQQLQLVRAMVRAESMEVEIVSGATVREPDGVAMSSRNQHLGPSERGAARSLSRALESAGAITDPVEAEHQLRRVMLTGGAAPEYHAVRHAETLMPLAREQFGPDGRPIVPCRALVAARVGSTRLLDNMAWPGPGAGAAHG